MTITAPGRARATGRARPLTSRAIRRPCALRRRRTGCWCSGRRSSGARGRGRRRRGSASSARTWWRADGVDRRSPARRPRASAAAEVMSTNFRSSPSEASSAWSSPAARDRRRRPAATSRPGPRCAALSISLFDRVADLADARPLGEQRGVGPAPNVAVGLDEDRRRPVGANTFHASSAVKLRNGAIQRSIACVMCHSAVCAERRASDFGAVV